MGAWYWFGASLSRVIARTVFSYRIVNREKVVETGGALVAVNHESYLDAPLAGIACRREIHYLARKSLLDWPILGPILPKLNVVPVDQDRADMSALKTVIRMVRAGHCALIFPEGGRTDDGQLQPAQPGVGLVIAKTLAPVIPMRIFGARAAFPRGSNKIRACPITLVIGDPLRFTEADLEGASGRELYQRLADRVMAAITALELPPDLRDRHRDQ